MGRALGTVALSLAFTCNAQTAVFESTETPSFKDGDLSRHKGAPPVINNIGLVAPGILCVEIEEFQFSWGSLKPYDKQPGDTIKVIKQRKDGSSQQRQCKPYFFHTPPF